jgi:HAMP domain-containing protein
MTDHHSPGFLGRLRVGPKITIIPLFFIAALAFIVWFTVYTLKDREIEATVAELVGRQRMLQQQHFAQSLLVSQGRLPIDRLRYTGQVWIDTQQALINGGPAVERLGRPVMVTLPKPPTEELHRKLEARLALIKGSVEQGEALQKVSPTDPEYNRILNEMIAAETPMQEGGMEIAKGYTAYAQEKAERLIRIEILIGLAVGLLGLAFSWLIARGITEPLQRVVVSARNISKGNLRIEKLPTGTSDEIGELSESFK